MRQPIRIWWILTVSFVYSIVFGSALSLWMATNSLAAFRIAEYTHQFDQFINDNLPTNFMLSRTDINKNFDYIISKYETDTLLSDIGVDWTYKNDMMFWDIANLPVISFLDLKGDCDDIARLYTYILNKKKYKTVFVTMSSPISGHAVAVYFDEASGETKMVEQAGIFSIKSNGSDLSSDIKTLIKMIHPEMTNYAIRTWDLKKIIEINSIKGDTHE